MCGICGVIGFDGEPVDRASLELACAALRHRGPDASGIWIDPSRPSVGLGATRLAILDPSPAGHQPMKDARGRFTLIFNGEVYNFRDIRHELVCAGERFVTESDTEVILAACAKWGPGTLNRFNGMWALCFFDRQSGGGFLARDRFGIKPVLYTASSAGLAFASEMRALVQLAGPEHCIDRAALLHHLVFGYIAHPSTIYTGIRRLPPGHYLPFDAQRAGEPIRFYDPTERERRSQDGDPLDKSSKGYAGYDEACRELRGRIARAVTARLVSDVPLGAFLSGGLDSSIVVKHAAEGTTGRIATFAVGYEGQRTYDERRYARLAARYFDTEHHEIVITEREAVEAIPRVLDHLGEPFGDSSIIPTSLVSRFAAQSVKVALSGDGGDELFAGYWRYAAHAALDSYLHLPAPLRAAFIEPLLMGLGASKSSGLGNRLRQFRKLLRTRDADPFSRHAAWSRILSPEAEGIVRDTSQVADTIRAFVSIAQQLSERAPAGDFLNRILAFDLQYQLPSDMLHKVDLASMMHSLEVRVPFLDPSVVEFASCLPSEFKLYQGRRKRVLMDAYRGHLPDEVLDRPKQGFEMPIGELLRGPLRDLFHDVVNRDTVEAWGLLSYEGAQHIYEEHLARQGEHADLLFALLSLCWWRSRKDVHG